MRADARSASRGVRSRLLGAMVAAGITLICMVITYITSLSTFGGTFALSLGLSSFGAAIALVLSARHEEQVHALATQLESEIDQLAERDTTGSLPAGEQASACNLQSPESAHPDSPPHTLTPSSPGTDGSL